MAVEKVVHRDLSYKIVGLAMKVHSALGNGFLEKVYENALMVLLRKERIKAEQQVPVKVYFENEVVGDYIADILVDDKVIIELKVADRITDIHRAQTINYLKATRIRLAIILNFGSRSLEHERVLYDEESVNASNKIDIGWMNKQNHS